MDRETVERLIRLEIRNDELEARIKVLEEKVNAWDSLQKKIIVKTVTWLIAAITAGIMYGWHLPKNIRESLIDWIWK